MKVCLDLTPLMTNSRLRGIGQYALELARALIRQPHLLKEIELCFLVGENKNIKVVSLAEGDKYLERIEQAETVLADNTYYFLKHTRGLAALLKAHVDIYHSTEPKGTPRPWGCQTIATFHDLIPVILHYPFDPPILPRQARAAVEWLRYRSLDHVIAISECSRQDLQRLTGLHEDKVDVVYHGIDRSFYHPVACEKEKEEIAKRIGTIRPYFFYVGGFDRRKQVPLLIESFAQTASQIEQVLVIAGALNSTQRTQFQSQINQLGLTNRVILLDFVPTSLLPAFYRQATAHVLLSLYEGFGFTLLEALACGCPVLALAASCIPEIAQDAALLLPESEKSIVSQALKRLAQDEALRADLRERGLKRALDFSWETCAARTIEVYRRCGSRK